MRCNDSETWELNTEQYRKNMVEVTPKTYIPHSLPELLKQIK